MNASIYSHLMTILENDRKPHIWGIVGGGFGLYGYMPAIASFKNTKILILEKNISFIKSRLELKKYLPLIETVATLDEILIKSDSLILAVPPLAQEEIFLKVGASLHYKYLILEKPLSVTPAASQKLLLKAIKLASSVRIGYAFLETNWGEYLMQSKSFLKKDCYKISWEFLAYHFKNKTSSWKADHNLGGGALRFYGIHLIAYIASINEAAVHFSKLFSDSSGFQYRWQAQFEFKGGGKVEVDLNCKSDQHLFSIKNLSGEVNLIESSPFSAGYEDLEDSRIPILKKIINSLELNNEKFYDFYFRVNRLWLEVETLTERLSVNG